MKIEKSSIWTAVIILGIVLVLGSVMLLVTANFQEQNALVDAKKTITTLKDILPNTHNAIEEERANLTMPSMEIDGLSYCGIIELPAYNTELPIYAYWDKGKVVKYPCRYSGSVYDGSLIIGGSDNKGQFDFMKTITVDDIVYITDMTGAKYTYTVTEIERTTDVSVKNLMSSEYDLTFFSKNTYSLDYTVVRCNFK